MMSGYVSHNHPHHSDNKTASAMSQGTSNQTILRLSLILCSIIGIVTSAVTIANLDAWYYYDQPVVFIPLLAIFSVSFILNVLVLGYRLTASFLKKTGGMVRRRRRGGAGAGAIRLPSSDSEMIGVEDDEGEMEEEGWPHLKWLLPLVDMFWALVVLALFIWTTIVTDQLGNAKLAMAYASIMALAVFLLHAVLSITSVTAWIRTRRRCPRCGWGFVADHANTDDPREPITALEGYYHPPAKDESPSTMSLETTQARAKLVAGKKAKDGQDRLEANESGETENDGLVVRGEDTNIAEV